VRPDGMAVGDVSRDGILDLVVANACGFDTTCRSNGTIGVANGYGNGEFMQMGGYETTGTDSVRVTLADLDGDGYLDAIAANYQTNDLSIFLQTGPYGGFSSPSNLNVGLEPRAVAAGDLNGDGANDLVSINQLDNSVSVLLNTRGTYVSTASSANPSKVGQPVTLTTLVVASLNRQHIPTGTVTFSDGQKKLGTVQLKGNRAQLTVRFQSKGRHMIGTSYSGDKRFNPNSAPPLMQIVQ
jgi:Big-like domain-containing protein/VCBS repeat protein